MSMSPCPECSTPVSDLAQACPRCGCPMKSATNGKRKGVLAVIGWSVFVLALVAGGTAYLMRDRWMSPTAAAAPEPVELHVPDFMQGTMVLYEAHENGRWNRRREAKPLATIEGDALRMGGESLPLIDGFYEDEGASKMVVGRSTSPEGKLRVITLAFGPTVTMQVGLPVETVMVAGHRLHLVNIIPRSGRGGIELRALFIPPGQPLPVW